jgi:hypothetical protein
VRNSASAAATEAPAPYRIYALALAGFILLYALDQKVVAARGEGTGASRGSIFWVHIAGFTLYGGIIGDALVGRSGQGGYGLLLLLSI